MCPDKSVTQMQSLSLSSLRPTATEVLALAEEEEMAGSLTDRFTKALRQNLATQLPFGGWLFTNKCLLVECISLLDGQSCGMAGR